MRRFLGLLPFAVLAACSSADAPSSSLDAGPGDAGTPFVDYDLIDTLAQAPKSSSLDCPALGKEDVAAYACPAMAPWASLPHAEDCAAWDGSTFPDAASLTGKCTSTLPSGEALKVTGPDAEHAGRHLLPDGHRLEPAGVFSILRDAQLVEGATQNVVVVPGTRWALTVDTGFGPHAVRTIDTSRIGSGDPTVSTIRYDAPATLGGGIAYRRGRVYVATNSGTLDALTLDEATGALTRDAVHSLAVPDQPVRSASPEWFVSDVTLVAGGTRLLASSIQQDEALLFDVDDASPTSGTLVGRVNLGSNEHAAPVIPPGVDANRFAYVPLTIAKSVVEIEFTASGPVKRRSFSTAASPMALAFVDERYFVVANTFGDSLTVGDRVSGATYEVPIEARGESIGTEPTSVAFDSATKRLYVTEAGISRLAAFDVALDATGAQPPRLTPAGRVDTLWWPSHVAITDDGHLLVSSLRGLGLGGSNEARHFEDDAVYTRLTGGIQRVDDTSSAAFVAGEANFRTLRNLDALTGAPKVSCPAGAAMDFPLPPTNTDGPSKRIDRVVVILRENKTFDSIFGDLPGVAGMASLTLKDNKADMESIWKNARSLARTFSLSDNYYTSAEISTLGHMWATYGRSCDFNERYWPIAGYSRSSRTGDLDIGGIAERGRPSEGSLFSWLSANQIPYDIFGEAVGMPASGGKTDRRYPGGFIQSMGYPDVEKSCYVAGRMRLRCDVGNVAFMTLSNDHTSGISSNRASPETHCAVNDEATGMMADALSHSPEWARTLLIVIEDDPASGGDHVDQHRSPILLVSPWIKRGFVSHTHLDVSSVHKIIAHLFGKPYPNRVVADAALPFDAFSNTPDFTPYEVTRRQWKQACGAETTAAERTLSMLWPEPQMDADPRFDAQVRRVMGGKPLSKLSPALEREISARLNVRSASFGDDD